MLIAFNHRSLLNPFRFSVVSAAIICLVDGSTQIAWAQNTERNAVQSRAWAPGAINHARQMRIHKDPDRDSQLTPKVIPKFEAFDDEGGRVATFQPGAATFTANNAFFQPLGTNGRSCFTCHQPQEGWTISAAGARARFAASAGKDPLFRLVDGATCPTADVSTLKAKRQAYKLLIDKGLFRVGLPMPAMPPLEFSVTSVVDPYGCTTNPATGLTSTLPGATTGIVSVYRRPLPSTNLGFLSGIMWDGREPSLENQANDATLIHAQADAIPTADQQAQIVAFEKDIFTAQVFDDKARDLRAQGANGGPVALSLQLNSFFLGVNDPIGFNPRGLPFDPNIFDLYRPWLGLRGEDDESRHRKSIARGEELFNTTPINITGVAGLNDDLNLPSIPGFCGTCHDTPKVGNHSVKAPLNIGIADAGANSPPALDISGLPIFTLKCTQGPHAGKSFVVTDPGRALISGKCADIGRLKGPILRGLASRAPYFHNGSAATLLDAVNFYDQRFKIGFTNQQKKDLGNFLNTL
jgi:cytochrome c peroxidase